VPWLGLTLTSSASAAGLLFPTIDPDGDPATRPTERALRDTDFFTSASDDRYPDVFGLASPKQPGDLVADRLSRVPSRSVTLSNDVPSSTRTLTAAAEELLA
jgi:hypothetical protein